MTIRLGRPFEPVISFNTTAGSSGLYAVGASTDWTGPANRAIRFSSMESSADYYVAFGTSNVVAASSNSMLVLGGTVESFYLTPTQTHAMVFSSTTVIVNITGGYGS